MMTPEDIAKGFDELRQLLHEMAQEADRRSQETERLIRENAQETAQQLQKTDQQLQKNAEQMRETDRMFQKTQRLIRKSSLKTDRKIRELTDLFTNQWGKLIEALVEPGCVKLFQERGINVKQSRPRLGRPLKDSYMEIDILLKNKVDKVAVVVEVKTTLKVRDVRRFIGKFDAFLDFFPEYREYTIYGAVAGMLIEEGVSEFAYRQGLFVLGLGREGLARMLNDKKFKPTIFNEIA
jgi:hypothetical protein